MACSSRLLRFTTLAALISCVADDPVTPAQLTPRNDAGTPTMDAGPGNIVYVDAAGGDDAQDGLSVATKLKTIGAALALAKTKSLMGAEIHVCRGVYRESNLIVAQSIALKGAYNCNTWERIPNYAATLGPDANETRIVNADPAASRVTLTVSGANDVAVEGFTIEGTSEGKNASVAMRITDGAMAHILNNRIVAGSTQVSAGVAAVGVEALGAKLQLEKNQVVGGAGNSPDETGVVVIQLYDGAGSVIAGNVIEGGTPKGVRGAVLINLDGSKPAEATSLVSDNVLIGQKPTSNTDMKESLFGIAVVSKQKAEITNNHILGIEAGCESSKGCIVHAIFIDGGAEVNITRNRIDGGTMVRPAGSAYYFRGIQLGGESKATVENNVILTSTQPSGDALDTVALSALGQGCPNSGAGCTGPNTRSAIAAIRHNTVQLASRGSVLVDQRQRGLFSTAIGLIAENNLFIGKNIDRGVEWYPCLGASFSAFRHNVFAVESSAEEFVSVRQSGAAFACNDAHIDTVAIAQASIPTAKDNLRLPSFANVVREPSVAVWPGNLAKDIFNLAPDAPCSIARAEPSTPITSRDILGTMRDAAKPSVGAYEFPQTGRCTP